MNELTYSIITIAVSLLSFIFSLALSFSYKKNLNKKVSPDIDINEMIKSENIIKDFLEWYSLGEAYTIEMIAGILKIKCMGDSESLYNNQATLSAPDKDGFRYVYFQKDLTAIQRRFVLAHECAHVLHEHPMPAARRSHHNDNFEEQLADYTAAALLMPYKKFARCLEEEKYFYCNKFQRKQIINLICTQFGVSDEMCIRRINEVTLLKPYLAL